jgi:putative flippase GtrA
MSTSYKNFVAMFSRYLVVGGGAFLIDFACFMLLVKGLGFLPEIAQVFSRTAGAAFGYLGHKKFSFAQPKTSTKATVVHATGYVIIFLVGLGLSPLILWSTLHALTRSLVLAKITTEIVMVIVNFTALKILFTGQHNRQHQT